MIVAACSDYLRDLSFVVIGGLLTIGSAYATSRFTRNRERDHWRWERRAEFMEQIQDTAGTLCERLNASWRIDDDGAQQLGALAATLRDRLGRLHAHRELQRAVRDLVQSAGIIIDDRGQFATPKDRDTALAELTRQCNEVYRLSNEAMSPGVMPRASVA
jgi:hypothetical protein